MNKDDFNSIVLKRIHADDFAQQKQQVNVLVRIWRKLCAVKTA